MALIVEDGTGLPNADSYISLADARAYAANYGYTLPDDDTEADVALRQGTVYVDLNDWKGERLTTTQSLDWPRTDVYCHGVLVPSDSVPLNVQHAQVVAAASYAAGLNPRANDDGRITTMEEVTGAVKVEYSAFGGNGNKTAITEADDKLKCYTNNQSAYSFGVCRG